MCTLPRAPLPTHMHAHSRTQPHSHTCTLPRACRAHLCGPELQDQSPCLHLLGHARLLQVQQVTLQPFAPVGPRDQPGWGQQFPQATFNPAHTVLIPCGDREQKVSVADPRPTQGHPVLTSNEAKGLPEGGKGVPVRRRLQGSRLNADLLMVCLTPGGQELGTSSVLFTSVSPAPDPEQGLNKYV